MGDVQGIGSRLRLPRRPDAAFAARQAVDALSSEIDEVALSDVRLLVTELIASRVQRPAGTAAAWVELDVELDDGRLHVEVKDYGQRWAFEPSPFTFEPEASSGWGLYLVDRLADRWALERGESHIRIWFELDL
ncbi:MAG: ATP-binding protein [Thermoleophilaceae bacterium]